MGRRLIIIIGGGLASVEVRLGDGGRAVYDGGADVGAARAFCDFYGVEPAGACASDLVAADGGGAPALGAWEGGVEVELADGTRAFYGGGGDAAAANAFCRSKGVDDPRCPWDVAVAAGADDDDRVHLALDLPDGYDSAADADARVGELRRRSALVAPFPWDAAVVPVFQPHWKLAFAGAGGDVVADVLKHWGDVYASALWHRPRAAAPRAGGRAKVGFLSSWFCNSAVGRLTAGLIARLDREAFAVHVYVLRDGKGRVRRDAFTDDIETSADGAAEVPASLDGARQLLAGEGLDCLVFTDIGMEPFSYALAFGRHARVQVAFWGHPTTTGIGGQALDYYLLMDAAEPGVEAPQGRYSEQLVRLDTLGAYYHANESGQLRPGKPRDAYAAESAALRRVPANRTLYAAPQHCLKFHPRFDAALLRILALDDAAVLVLRTCGPFPDGSPTVADRLARAGVDVAARVLGVGPLPLEDYARLFGGSHVALETFPFGGSITTLDAFEAGAPVVALAPPEGAAARPALTRALYAIAGVDGLVAPDVEAYARLAVAIANDGARRAAAAAAIAAGRGRLYESAAAVAEVGGFLARALRVGRGPS